MSMPAHRLGVRAAVVDGALVPGDVAVTNGVVEAVGLGPAGRGLAVPGLVDLQVNGYGGADLQGGDAQDWARAGAALLRDGVTAFVANIITAAIGDVERCLQQARTWAANPARLDAGTTPLARLLGCHLEGPFLSPSRAGMHPAELLQEPDAELLDRWIGLGPVSGLTIAPELAGAVEMIKGARARGLLVALGHTAATAAQAHAGFDAGASTVTHLLNGMGPLTAREPGCAGTTLARPDVSVQLVCYGVHLAPETVTVAMAAASGRWVLVTDAMAAAGSGDGSYHFGVAPVSVQQGCARLADGTLAGSVLTMAEAVRNAVGCGATTVDAVNAATLRPAALLGLDHPCLRPGERADLVVLDEELAVTQVLLAGRSVRDTL